MRPVTRRQVDHHAARSAATRAQVTSTTARLLESGETFSEISVQRILEEAGVSRATFYAHFRNKSDVLVRLTDELRGSLLELASQWEPGAPEGGADGFARFFENVIAIHRAHQGVLTAVREAASYDTEVGDFYTADLEGFEETVLRVLRSEQAAGSTPPDVDATAAGRVIVWGGSQAIAHHIAVDDGSGDVDFARELAQIWWHGAFRRPAG
ncbi:TetR/AcrR family transcriptional regulator [Streptomyces sp. NPDC096057]|uniref:TetR/AcrR family transcriptional regulator n=1 Tax=Streptomyces sp. NPDC096057 TaxID=3155543 RepID=UPI003321BCF6